MRGWNDAYNAIKDPFNAIFRNEGNAIWKSNVKRTIQRFGETNTVNDRSKPGKSVSATNPKKSLDVCSFL